MQRSLIFYLLLIFGIVLISVGAILKVLRHTVGDFKGIHFVFLGLVFAFLGIFLNKYLTKE